MTSLSSSSWFKVCLLVATMSLYACGQREMVLPHEHCTGATETPNANNTVAKANAAASIETHILSNGNTATTGMRKTGGPDRKHSGGGGPIIVIEDTHFKGAGAK